MYLPIEGLSADEQDLRWYFTQQPNPSALVSSYPAMVFRLLLRRAKATRRPQGAGDDCALDHLDRSRRIERILEATGSDAARVLSACLSGLAPRHLGTFGRLAALVLDSPVALKAHRAARIRRPLSEWLDDLVRDEGRSDRARQTLDAIDAELRGRYAQALLTYREGKRKAGCTGRAEQARRIRAGGRHA
jgi:hypothetical protein